MITFINEFIRQVDQNVGQEGGDGLNGISDGLSKYYLISSLEGYIEYENGDFKFAYQNPFHLWTGEKVSVTGWRWYRTFWRFDISSIPDEYEVVEATFKAYYFGEESSGNPEGVAELAHIQDIGSSLDNTDWDKSVIENYGTLLPRTTVWGWYSKDVTNAIDLKNDFVSFRLKSTEEDNDSDEWAWDINIRTSTYPAKLIIVVSSLIAKP